MSGVYVKVRFSRAERDAVDGARGDVPREEFVRRACADAVEAQRVTCSGSLAVVGEGRVIPLRPGVERGRIVQVGESPAEVLARVPSTALGRPW